MKIDDKEKLKLLQNNLKKEFDILFQIKNESIIKVGSYEKVYLDDIAIEYFELPKLDYDFF